MRNWFNKRQKQAEDSKTILIPEDELTLMTMHYLNDDGSEGEPVF